MPAGTPARTASPWWRRLLEGWQGIAARFGFAQTQVLLTAIYLIVLGPLGAALRLGRSDPLEKRPLPPDRSGWHEVERETQDVARLRHPF